MTSSSDDSRGAGNDSPLTPAETADCASFAAMYDALKTDHAERGLVEVTYKWLHAQTGIAANTWGAYWRGEKSMSDKAMAWCARIFSIRPQDRFKTWPWPWLVQTVPDARITYLQRKLSSIPEAQRTEDMRAIHAFLRASPARREKIARAIDEIAGVPARTRAVPKARSTG